MGISRSYIPQPISRWVYYSSCSFLFSKTTWCQTLIMTCSKLFPACHGQDIQDSVPGTCFNCKVFWSWSMLVSRMFLLQFSQHDNIGDGSALIKLWLYHTTIRRVFFKTNHNMTGKQNNKSAKHTKTTLELLARWLEHVPLVFLRNGTSMMMTHHGKQARITKQIHPGIVGIVC